MTLRMCGLVARYTAVVIGGTKALSDRKFDGPF